jgi:hypothetical protein
MKITDKTELFCMMFHFAMVLLALIFIVALSEVTYTKVENKYFICK